MTLRAKAADATNPLLHAEEIGVRFGSFVALEGVTISVFPGEIVGVIGPNGAGKSTFVNAVAGKVRVSSGSVRVHDREVGGARPSRRAHLGLVRTFQTPELFPTLTLQENVELGARRTKRQSRNPETAAIAEKAAEVASAVQRRLGLEAASNVVAAQLSGGEQKLLELVRGLAAGPDVFLLDEPTAGVPSTQRRVVLEALRDYVDGTNCSALVIEHDMDFVKEVCDWIYVLASGQLLANSTWSEISKNPEVIAAYLGSDT